MKTICLVGCTSRKLSAPHPAEELYDSALFDGARYFSKTRCDQWHILSAKHGLVAPRQILKPYNQSLLEIDSGRRMIWAKDVFCALQNTSSEHDKIIFLAGKQYREFLTPMLLERGNSVAAPLASFGIGKQVAWLQKLMKEPERLKDLDRLYDLMSRLSAGLNGSRLLAESDGKKSWPEKGLYLFFEPSEFRMSSPFDQRLVRIGTHAVSRGSMTTLWDRLRTHRGASDGTGNHRGSIFRLHVGEAFRRRLHVDETYPHWGHGQSATALIRQTEIELEKRVSEYLGRMSLLWIAIGDTAGPQSDRAYLERNIIGLISGPTGPMDASSRSWLGNDSTKSAISSSGLWNINHVGHIYDRRMLDVLEQYIEVTIGKSPSFKQSIAPRNWHSPSSASSLYTSDQLDLQ